MSYDVKVRHVADSGDGISVEVWVDGEAIAHTFPKGQGWLDEDDDGKPRFVDKMVDIYKQRQRLERQKLDDEQKIDESRYENEDFTVD